MKKRLGVLLLVVTGLAHANEVVLDFGLFDGAQAKVEKFEAAFPKKAVVSKIVYKGKTIDLAGNWTIIGNASQQGTVTEEGSSLVSRGTAVGYLTLQRQLSGGESEYMWLRMSLDGRKRYEYLNGTPTPCAKSEGQVYQQIDSDRQDKWSCITFLKTTVTPPQDRPVGQQSLAEYVHSGVPFPAGSMLYEQFILESRNASSFIAYRVSPASAQDQDTLLRSARQLQQDIQQSFF